MARFEKMRKARKMNRGKTRKLLPPFLRKKPKGRKIKELRDTADER